VNETTKMALLRWLQPRSSLSDRRSLLSSSNIIPSNCCSKSRSGRSHPYHI